MVKKTLLQIFKDPIEFEEAVGGSFAKNLAAHAA
jgi:hypothetical protein